MVNQLLYSAMGIFVAMDTIGTLPLYLGMTKGMQADERKRIVRTSILVAAIVAFTFMLAGKWIFKLMGISIHDFKVGGGIVLLVMSILDLTRSKGHEGHSLSTGIVPLAVPLITGPSLITTVTLQVSIYGYLVVSAALLANFVFTWFTLNRGGLITRTIGAEGTDIISKIAALLMTAIAFSMIRTGIMDGIKSSLN